MQNPKKADYGKDLRDDELVKQLPAGLLMKICGPFRGNAGFGEADRKTAREQLNKKATYVFSPIIVIGFFAALFSGLFFLI